jgi:hypothetical protein
MAKQLFGPGQARLKRWRLCLKVSLSIPPFESARIERRRSREELGSTFREEEDCNHQRSQEQTAVRILKNLTSLSDRETGAPVRFCARKNLKNDRRSLSVRSCSKRNRLFPEHNLTRLKKS